MLNHPLCELFVVLMLCVTCVNHRMYSVHVVSVLKYTTCTHGRVR